MGNFINLPYSLAMRHQQYLCYLHVNTQGFPGWADNIEVGKGMYYEDSGLQISLVYCICGLICSNFILVV